jgi:amidase
MLVAKHWQESTLYRAADAFERVADWQTMGANGHKRKSKAHKKK